MVSMVLEQSNPFGAMVVRPANPFAMVLPPQALPLMLVVLIMLPLTLLAGESLFIPLLEAIRSILSPENDVAMRTVLPPQFYLKLAGFAVLAFLGFFQVLQRVRLIYMQTWVTRFSRPDPLHVDYQPDSQQSMLAAVNWSMYRWFLVLLPPAVIVGTTVLVGFGEVFFFSAFVGLPRELLPLVIITFMFLMCLLGLFSVFALANSIWTLLVTLFGDVVAITEPDVRPRTVYERCKRIAFSSPLVYPLYAAYLIFGVLVLAGGVALVVLYDIQDVIQFRLNWPLVLLIELAVLMLYVGLGYLKLSTYHHALKLYYAKLPGAFRDRFTAPPAVNLYLPE